MNVCGQDWTNKDNSYAPHHTNVTQYGTPSRNKFVQHPLFFWYFAEQRKFHRDFRPSQSTNPCVVVRDSSGYSNSTQLSSVSCELFSTAPKARRTVSNMNVLKKRCNTVAWLGVGGAYTFKGRDICVVAARAKNMAGQPLDAGQQADQAPLLNQSNDPWGIPLLAGCTGAADVSACVSEGWHWGLEPVLERAGPNPFPSVCCTPS